LKNDKTSGSQYSSGNDESIIIKEHLITADDLPVLLCRFLKDGSIIFVNKAYAKFFNISRQELIGTKFFIPPSEFEVTDTSKPFHNQYLKQIPFKFQDDSIRWIEWTINRIVDKAVEGFEYQAIGHDITEFKNVEENLTKVSVDLDEQRKSENLEKALYQISHAVIDTEDLNKLYQSIHSSLGNVLHVENFFIAIYDKEKNLLSFPYMVDEYDEPYETAPPGRGLTEYVLRTGKPLHVDQEIFKGLVDAGEVDLYGTDSLDWIGVPLKIGENTIGVLVVQSYSENIRLGKRDLNVLIYVSDQIALAIERTRTHSLLKIREERYRLLFDKAADLIAIVDPQGKVLDINYIFEEETGYERSDIIGVNIFESEFLTTKSSVSVAFYISRLLLGKEVPVFEIEIIKKDKGIITYELRGVPIREKEELIGVQIILRNVTERKKTAAKLYQSEKQLSNLMSSLPGMAYRCNYNNDWTMEFVSQGCFELTGYVPDELMQNNKVAYFELIHPEDKENVFVTIREAVAKMKSYQIIYRIRTKNEGEKWVWEKGSPQFFSKGKTKKLEGFVSDISSRIKAEGELIHSEEKYRTLIDSIQDGVFLIVDGNVAFINRAFGSMIGYDINEIQGEAFTKFVSPEDFELVVNNYRLRQEGKPAPASYEWRMLHKNGNRVYVNMSARVINYQGKKATIGTIKDVTLQKDLEETLLSQKNLFKGVADASNILLSEKDFNTAISKTLESLGQSSSIDRVYIFENGYDKVSNQPNMNQRYEWTNGIVSSEIDNPDLQNLPYFPMFENWYPILNTGGIINSLVKDLNPALGDLLSKQGIKSILLVPIKVKNNFWGFIGFDYCKSERVWSDSEITMLQTTAANIGSVIEKEIAKKEIIIAKEAAEEMSKIKSNFLANMSHELRTPLIAILGYTEILKSEIEHVEWNDMITTIMHSGKRLLETLNLILDLSKVESDKVQINYNEINLSEEITDIVTMLNPVAQKKHLYLKSKIESETILAKLDKRLLHSIITNLVNNAIKYTHKGGVTIELSTINSSGGNYAMIRVADTGIGIAKEDQETIFDEFRQVSEGYNRHFEGSGLGLTIARKFAEKMGGSISLESEVGVGSTFTVVFNCEEEKQNTDAPVKLAKEELLPAPVGRSKKVLMVDDDVASRRIVELFLRGEIEIESASNSKEALEKINAQVYSLVLMDISLGKGISGIEIMQKLRGLPGYENIPVIAVTAHAMVGDKEKFLDSGFDDYLSKPFGKNELINKVHNWININGSNTK
jgi:PAS domain S-box-containing protein